MYGRHAPTSRNPNSLYRFNRPLKDREVKTKGILKPSHAKTNTSDGVIRKLKTFFKGYSLHEYENDTNVDELLKSIDIKPVKRLQYDDEIKYESAPLPDLRANKKLSEVRYNDIANNENRVNERVNDWELKSQWELNRKNEWELHKRNERIRILERDRNQLHLEKHGLKHELQELERDNQFLKVEMQHMNENLVRANGLNDDLSSKFDQLNHQHELVQQENSRLVLEMQDYQKDFLHLHLQVIEKNYQLEYHYLQDEFEKYHLKSHPELDAHLVYYSQIRNKISEYNDFFQKYHQLKLANAISLTFNLDLISREYDYESIIELRSLLVKLWSKLNENFEKKVSKSRSHGSKFTNHLSMIHQLKLQSIELLQTIDEIIVILTNAH